MKSFIHNRITDKIVRTFHELNSRLSFHKNGLNEVLNFFEFVHTLHEVQDLIDEVVVKTQRLLGAQKCSFMLVNSDKKELFIKGQKGLDNGIADVCRIKLGNDIAGRVALMGRAVLVKDIENDRHFKRPNRPSYKSASFISAPIIYQGKPLGVINVADKTGWGQKSFSELDLRILNLISRQVSFLMGTRQLSVTDHLTDLLNFRYFTKALDREFHRTKRYSNSLCLIMIDVDDFKSYNDTFGHLEGDDLLQRVAVCLKRNIRSVDTACRYAGDEFIIILPETEIHQAKVVAKKISNNIDMLRFKQKVTISFGIANQTLFMENSKDLIASVDQALYKAKREGKNRAFVYG